MSAHPRKMLKEVKQMLAAYGIEVIGDELGKKHRRLRITSDGKYATIIVSISPSDRRTYHNIAKSARQALREAP